MLKHYGPHIFYSVIGILCVTVIVLSVGVIRLDNRFTTLETFVNNQFALVDANVLTLGEELQGDVDALALDTAATSNALNALEDAQATLAAEAETSLADIVADTLPSVVSIVVKKEIPVIGVRYVDPFANDPELRGTTRVRQYYQKGTQIKQIASGTGFVVTKDGYVVTNRHVVADTKATFTAILQDETELEAFVLHRDEEQDIAVMKVVGNFDPIQFGNSKTAQLGETVFAIGNALGEFSNSVSVGVLSGKNRTIAAKDNSNTTIQFEDVLQTDAAINKGNSGGPLLDAKGNAIGVNVATVIGSDNISFAIPANTVKEIVEGVLGEEL